MKQLFLLVVDCVQSKLIHVSYDLFHLLLLHLCQVVNELIQFLLTVLLNVVILVS
uniref:Uncharacterized protein n=1 Tax=Phlebia radiata TaxID=5308 RepID=L8B982_PHLRA|nr:hypothetical protein PRA_mt0023 [Phlebia radiata]CCE89168.1 hypothetical protein PRA_mt0023 [Phlebia radiata]